MSGQVIRDRLEIVSTLRQLALQSEPLLAQWEAGAPSRVLPTRIVDVNPDYEELVFDCFTDDQANHGAVQATQVNFLGHLDGIEVRFYASHGEATTHEGRPALRMRIPAQLLRLQRRESFRVPAAHSCEIALVLDGSPVRDVAVGNLSIGGVKLVINQPFDAKLGQVIEKCQLRLGNEGNLQATLEVRSVQAAPTRSCPSRVFIGCRFVSLSTEAEMQLARFTQKLERRSVR